MSLLLHGDCLDELKNIDNESVDLIFCDLPYGQTSCKWDCEIDLDKFWIEIIIGTKDAYEKARDGLCIL